jgi:tetratricopeptide (TPR) repeat protein
MMQGTPVGKMINNRFATEGGHMRQGLKFYKRGDYNLAIAEFSADIEADPRNEVAYKNRALCFLKMGDFEKSISDCNESIKLDHSFTAAYRVRGKAYEENGELESARADYDMAEELGSNRDV